MAKSLFISFDLFRSGEVQKSYSISSIVAYLKQHLPARQHQVETMCFDLRQKHYTREVWADALKGVVKRGLVLRPLLGATAVVRLIEAEHDLDSVHYLSPPVLFSGSSSRSCPLKPLLPPGSADLTKHRCAPSAHLFRSVIKIAIIGGGPAGLRAAEVAAARGAAVTLFDAKPSVGRKFLVAGRGGLNLTHSEPRESFATRYGGTGTPDGFWPSVLADFDAEALRAWAAGLGVETFVGTSGRIFPREFKAAPLLRRWVERLRKLGVHFALRHRWTGIRPGARWQLDFQVEGEIRRFEADAVIFSLGGGSWPETGSDGGWVEILQRLGVAVAPLVPANCGWELPWPAALLAEAEGKQLKNITARAGATTAVGELMITRYGLEGGATYQLGPALRAMTEPEIVIDLKPSFTVEQLVTKLGTARRNFLAEAWSRWRLSDAAFAILKHLSPPETLNSAATLAAATKCCRLRLTGPRPLAEAISSAGGVCWSELDAALMLQRLPGVFVAGEMIDWEAPTGGYLMQGCFATGTRAAQGALAFPVQL